MLFFLFQCVLYYIWALTSSDFISWFLYILCLCVTVYYGYKSHYDFRPHYKKAYEFYSLIIFTIICLCRIIDFLLMSSPI